MTHISVSEVIGIRPKEMFAAAYIGFLRQYTAMKRGSRADFDDDTCERNHIDGAIAEYVAAKALNRCWIMGVDTFGGPGDLFGGIEVVCARKHTDSLIVRERNTDLTRPMVCVTGGMPGPWYVWGWILCGDAKTEAYASQFPGDTKTVWMVPRADLRPLTELGCPIKGVGPDKPVRVEVRKE